MTHRGTVPESYITEYTLVYEDYCAEACARSHESSAFSEEGAWCWGWVYGGAISSGAVDSE